MVSRMDLNFFKGILQKGWDQGRASLFPAAPLISQSLSPSLTVCLRLPVALSLVSVAYMCLSPSFSISVSVSGSLWLFLPLPLFFFLSLSLSWKTLLRACSKIQKTATFTQAGPNLIPWVVIPPWSSTLKYPINSFPGRGEEL